MIKPGLADRLRERRLDLGMTQEHLATVAGLSRTPIARIETRRVTSPHISTLQALARALATTVDALRYGTGELAEFNPRTGTAQPRQETTHS